MGKLVMRKGENRLRMRSGNEVMDMMREGKFG
jgi:hypothetical protein